MTEGPMTEVPKPSPLPADAGPLSPGQVRALQIAIVVMGIMIVLGILGVVARMFYLASNRPPQATRAATAAAGPSLATDARIQLLAGSTVKSVTLDGDRMALHYESATGAGIAIVDLPSGRVVSRFRIEPEPPR
jgi:hypothetical protein